MESDRKQSGRSKDERRRRPRIVVAVQDDEVRRALDEQRGESDLNLELVEPSAGSLGASPGSDDPSDAAGPNVDASRSRRADVLVVRRSKVRPEDLRLVDAYTDEASNPELIVVYDQPDDADRARLLAAGASGVVAADPGPAHRGRAELREALEAIAEVKRRDESDGAGSEDGRDDSSLADFRSRSPRMRRFLTLVRRIVDSDSSLLITGETGVGKERLAQAIHRESPRGPRPFVSVNCGAIPESLLESELFGHEVGSFTGAVKLKKGRFEQADGGTIFLDEIGEMPLHLQVNLLTVLQRRRIQRVGSEKALPIDVRVMAATNRDVAAEVRAGRFREDLYYRLNVVTLEIPPLRERSEDIPDLVGRVIHHFRDALRRRRVEGISDEALDALVHWHWPGNVRELVNAVEHAMVLCNTSQIDVEDLPEPIVAGVARPDGRKSVRAAGSTDAPEAPDEPAEPDVIDVSLPLAEARRLVTSRFERRYLDALLRSLDGRIGEVAKRAGITPRALYTKMKAHGLRKETYR